MNDFLQMGGYAFYVWTSYGLTLLVLGVNFILARSRERSLMAQISRNIRRGPGQKDESQTA